MEGVRACDVDVIEHVMPHDMVCERVHRYMHACVT